MSKLSFKNFRGFINFQELDFDGITFLIGKNNSGKSTAIKAFEFISDYIKSPDLTCLDFDSSNNIMSFKKILCNKSDDDFIEFELEKFNYKFSLTLSKININPNHPMIRFSIKDMKLGFEIVLDTDDIEFPFFVSLNSENIIVKHSLSEKFFTNNLSYDNFLDILEKELSVILEKYLIRIDGVEVSGIDGREWINAETRNLNKLSLVELKQEYQTYLDIRNSIVSLNSDFILEKNFIFIDSFQSKKRTVLSIHDEENLLTQLVHLHFRNNIENKKIITSFLYQNSNDSKETIKSFIIKWLIGFEIGDDYKIELIYEGYYLLYIKKDDEWIKITEMGLGTVRIVTTILAITFALYSSRKSGVSIFVFEEPELNLHPALQSKLADLFYEVYTLSDKKIQIIVETHSEYIIRRSQVLVAEKKLESIPNQNPFKIYYFNSEGDKKHYQIKYDEDGFLMNGFGPGFFDEATSSTLELMRLRKVKLN